MRSFGAKLALRQTAIAALLLAVLFLATFLLTRRFLWHGLKVTAAAKHSRLVEAMGPDFEGLSVEEMQAICGRIIPTIQTDFYVEFILEGHGVLGSTNNLRSQTLVDPSRTDNVYLLNVPGSGRLFVRTFRDGRVTVRVAQNLDTANIILAAYTRGAILLFLGALALNACQIWWSTRAALRPVSAMQHAAERISSENLGERIRLGPVRDEISMLGALLNRTFDRIQSSFEQIRRFTADASHELKTPLAVARAHTEILLRPGIDPATQETAVHGVLAELTQIEEIIDDLLLLARADSHALPFRQEELVIGAVWSGVLPEIHALAEYHRVHTNTPEQHEGRILGDGRWLRHVVLNLVSNAIRHSPAGGTLTISSHVKKGRWTFTVEDEGPGVPQEKLEMIFERFYQVRPDGNQTMEGTGLGLAICKSLVQLHGGWIAAENCTTGHGLRMIVELPTLAPAG